MRRLEAVLPALVLEHRHDRVEERPIAVLLDHLAGDDGRELVMGEVGQEGRVGGGERQADRVPVEDVHRAHGLVEARVDARLWVSQPLEAVLDVVGRHLAPVVELHGSAELEDVGQAVIGYVPGLGEAPLQFRGAGNELDQAAHARQSHADQQRTCDEAGGEEAGYRSCAEILDRNPDVDAICAVVDAGLPDGDPLASDE